VKGSKAFESCSRNLDFCLEGAGLQAVDAVCEIEWLMLDILSPLFLFMYLQNKQNTSGELELIYQQLRLTG